MPGAEAVDQLRVELRAPPLPGHVQRGLGAAGVVERLDGVGQVDQADGRSETTGTSRPGHPFPVPSFERLQQRLAYGRAQPEPFGKIARHPAVRLHQLLHRATGGRQEFPDQPDPAETRLTATEMAADEHRHGDTVQVLIAGIGVQPDLIAEQRCQLSGVDGTAHPRQQRRVIRRRAGRLIHPGLRPQPHGNDGLAQHPLHRPPHPKIGDKRQHRHQLGKSHPLQGIGSNHPDLPHAD